MVMGVSTKFIFLLLFIGVTICYELPAQSFSNMNLQEAIRNKQLADTVSPEESKMINANQVSIRYLDSAWHIRKPLQYSFSVGHNKWSAGLMPLSVTQQYNSLLPYDWNQGPMIPARGYQLLASFGAYLNMGKHFSIQVMPEYVYAENRPFETVSQQLGDAIWESYYRFLNTSDIPVKFGDQPYKKFFPGQTSIRYNTNKISLGISTENLWWGPGWRNALVMSTNAPGFIHLTANTIKPIHTRIGNFEGQVIAGKLDGSGILPPRIYSSYNGVFLYQPKNPEWRYITGMVITWQPKWVKNLYLGLAKTSYLYHKDISNPLDALPLQGFFGKAITSTERNGQKSSIGSLFARYLMPKDNAEIYFEYGRKDMALLPWTLIQSQPYWRAYVAGLRKLFPTAHKDTYIQLAVEMAELGAPNADLLLNNPDSWYTSTTVRQGYTQLGRVLGAGIGPGSSSQTLGINWIRGMKKIGLEFERVLHNNDFYYYAFTSIGDYRRYWIDLSTALKIEWDYKRFLLSAKLAAIRSDNYQWLVIDVNPRPDNYFAPSNEYLNFSGKLQLSYRF